MRFQSRLFVTFWPIITGTSLLGQVVIREGLHQADPSGRDAVANQQWLELYNQATARLIRPLCSDRTGWPRRRQRTLPALSLPAGAFLVVPFAGGTNRLDFSGGAGDYYTGDPAGASPWNPAMDEAALYSPAAIVDFVAWTTGPIRLGPRTTTRPPGRNHIGNNSGPSSTWST